MKNSQRYAVTLNTPPSKTYRVLIRARTELSKGIRRTNAAVNHSDRGCPMLGRKYITSPHPWANTITSISKDNYLIISY